MKIDMRIVKGCGKIFLLASSKVLIGKLIKDEIKKEVKDISRYNSEVSKAVADGIKKK